MSQSQFQPQHADLPGAYWVLPGQLLAGPYPCAAELPMARRRIAALLSFGVDLIIDLTEPGEYNLRPYWPLLSEQPPSAPRNVVRTQLSIPDMDTPTVEQMQRILAQIDTAIDRGAVVYVHCFGGIGRTGTVIGCYLVRRGMQGDAALEEIRRLRSGLPDAQRISPETAAQRQMVRTWAELSTT